MKKSYIIILTATAFLAATACNKELDIQVTDHQEGALTTIFVEASFEQDTKVSLDNDGKTVYWANGDKIKAVYNGGEAESEPLASGGKKATFTISYPEGKVLKYASYPSSVVSKYDGSKFKVTIPEVQDGTAAGAIIQVAEFSENMNFKILGGVLQVNVNDDTVKGIRISSNDSSPLAGTATVTFSSGVPEINSITNAKTSIELAANGAGTYYAAVLPCSMSKGVRVELLDNVGTVLGEKESANALSVSRRQIIRLGTINVAAETLPIYFFKPNGNGDGSSWDNPMGVSGLSTILNGGNDAKLYLAHGTYTLSSEIALTNHHFEIYGGFPATASGTTRTDRDLTQETAISGGGKYRLFVMNQAGIEFVADGITFKNAYKSSKDVACALILQSQKSATFNNCVICDNVKEGEAGGGAVRANKGDITFSNCTIKNNSSVANGGAMSISGGNVIFDNCLFEGNKSISGGGGALVISGGTVDINNCEFVKNKAEASSQRGSAIFSSGSSIVRLNRCYLAENKTRNGGTIWSDSKTGTLFLNACSFYKDSTAYYASAIGSRGICGVHNCAFQLNVNSQTQGASHFYTVNGTTLISNSSFRLHGRSSVALHAANGTTYIFNDTMVNAFTSETPLADNEGVALKSSGPLVSYGHSLVNKFYEDKENSYSLADNDHKDLLDYTINQKWHTSRRCIYWTDWSEPGVHPAGFEFATPARMEAAIAAFDAAAETNFGEWLRSLDIDGHNALQTDILGYVRGADTLWPGDYENRQFTLK